MPISTKMPKPLFSAQRKIQVNKNSLVKAYESANSQQDHLVKNNFCQMSDGKLVESLRELCQKEQRGLSAILQHLHEIKRRKLVLKLGWPSLFEYCVGHLGFSEAGAYKRTKVAGLVGSYPQILKLLETGQTHLSNLALVAAHLKPENAEELFKAACSLRKRELEKYLAHKFPKIAGKTGESCKLLGKYGRAEKNAGAASALNPISPVNAADAASFRTPAPANSEANTLIYQKPEHASQDIENTHKNIFPGEKDASEKLIYRLVLEADESTVLALEKLKTHLSSRYPKGASKSEIVALALKEMLAQFEKTSTKKSTLPDKAVEAATAQKPKQQLRLQPEAPTTVAKIVPELANKAKHSRYIPAQVERIVRARAQGSCEFVSLDEGGQRCGSQWNVHLHHLKPFAKGGSSLDPDNLALFCAVHNQMQAQIDFPGRIFSG